MKAQVKISPCVECGAYIHMQRDLSVRPRPDLDEMPGYVNVQEMIVTCSQCGDIKHGYFFTDRMERFRKKWRKRLDKFVASGGKNVRLSNRADAAKTSYEKLFVETNTFLRQKVQEKSG